MISGLVGMKSSMCFGLVSFIQVFTSAMTCGINSTLFALACATNASIWASVGLAAGFFIASNFLGKLDEGCWMRSADDSSTLGAIVS